MLELIESAYCSGYEPSSDSLTIEEMFNEAQEFLLKMI